MVWNYGIFKSQEIKGKVKRLTIKRDWCGDIYIAVLTDWCEQVEVPRTGCAAGFDYGLKTYLVGSDGTRIENPQFLKRELDKYRKLSSQFSKKAKGSNNSRKARRERATLLRHINNQRADFGVPEEVELPCGEGGEEDSVHRQVGGDEPDMPQVRLQEPRSEKHEGAGVGMSPLRNQARPRPECGDSDT